jgi:hypothetical protein
MLECPSIATAGIYLHANEQELEQVASVMPRILSGGEREGLFG